MSKVFDSSCRRCPRLAAFLDSVQLDHLDYYCKPVPPFGDPQARLLIVGLAPGKHGANRSGRAFTGDHAGILLYATLFKYGMASAPVSTSADDGLELRSARITNAVKCLPPDNKPLPPEIKACNEYLRAELAQSHDVRVILALGRIAHEAVLRACDLPTKPYRFAHGAEHRLENGRVMVDSYHCSRYNTQTRRLTTEMFETVVDRARSLAVAASVCVQ
ncbi:MAG TPA: uracil-DNA glycosylase [Steroidobacteraceae bacterium]|jgi:uracil-DNA glycosylase family 4|nr:uracil-DNA glycosylase [Steroidobacteraceae bacterium]